MRQIGRDPIFIERGEGCELVDVDGNRYIDWVGSWGPLILGHADPVVVAAVIEAAKRGTSYGAATEGEVELAEEVADRFPSVEMMRMTSSGTEAAMSAVRLARAVTGREVVVKFAGAYHGHSDGLLAEAGSGTGDAGRSRQPRRHRRPGRRRPWWSRGTTARPWPGALAEHEVAALLAEPVAANMGVVPPADGFLEFLREATRDAGALLVFDEVITGFRVARGGAQELYGVEPDLTVIGKIARRRPAGRGLRRPAASDGADRPGRRRLPGGHPLGQPARGRRRPAPPSTSSTPPPTSGSASSPTASPTVSPPSPRDARCRSPASAGSSPSSSAPARSPTSPTPRACDLEAHAAFCRAMLDRGVYPPPAQFEAWFVSLAHDEASDRPHPRGRRRVAATRCSDDRSRRRRLLALAAQLREEETPISPHVVDPAAPAELGELAAAGPRAAAAPAEYALVVEAVREGYLLHYGSPGCWPATTPTSPCSPATISTRSASIASPPSATPIAVAILADLISRCAHLHAERPDRRGDPRPLALRGRSPLPAEPGRPRPRDFGKRAKAIDSGARARTDCGLTTRTR